jgi:hypothetical protein
MKTPRNIAVHPQLVHKKPISIEQLDREHEARQNADLNRGALLEHELDNQGLKALDQAYNSHPDRQGSSTRACIEGGVTDDGSEFQNMASHSREYRSQEPDGHRAKKAALKNPSSEDSVGQGGSKLSTPQGSQSLGRHWAGPGYGKNKGSSYSDNS